MPWRNTLGEGVAMDGAGGNSETCSMQKRASYCSERFRPKRGQIAVSFSLFLSGWDGSVVEVVAGGTPGISPAWPRRERNWQPLQTPRVKVSGRAKKDLNEDLSSEWCRTDLAHPAPAPRTSP